MGPHRSRPSLAVTVVTETFLGTLFVIGVGAIVLLPGYSASVASSLPEYRELRDPLLALAICFVILGLLVLAISAVLVGRTHRGTIRTPSSRMLAGLIAAALVGAIALVLTSAVAISAAQAGSPFLALVQATTCVALVVLARIALVLRDRLDREGDQAGSTASATSRMKRAATSSSSSV